MTKLSVKAISKPVEDWSSTFETIEERVAKLPLEVRDIVRADFETKKAKDEVARQKSIIDHAARFEAWLKDNSGKYDPEFEERAQFTLFEITNAARQKGFTVAGIKPFWIMSFEHWLMYSGADARGIFEAMPTAGRITVPLSINGGSISITIESKKAKQKNGNIETYLERPFPISGFIDGNYITGAIVENNNDEMHSAIVQLKAGTPQIYADRIASLFEYMNENVTLPDELPAILASSDKCFECGKALDDQISKALLIGPTCARKLGVFHNAEAAQKILEKRREYQRIICEEI